MSNLPANTRARFAIMSDVLSYPSVNFNQWSNSTYDPLPGDLVALCSAGPSEWYLSWYVEKIEPKEECGWMHHIVESIETGREGDWWNVSFSVYDRERVSRHPEWRWSDRQFAFWDRLVKTALETIDDYPLRANKPCFGDDFSVELSFRKHIFRMDKELIYKESFSDWRKVTKPMMADLAKRALAASDARKAS